MSYNRTVYASGAVAPSGYEKPQSACGLGAVFLRHIFAVAGNLRFPLSQPQKRHIQPERYAKFFAHPRNLDMNEQPEIAQEKNAQIRHAAILGGGTTAIKNMLDIKIIMK
jgi:hypothetical protein